MVVKCSEYFKNMVLDNGHVLKGKDTGITGVSFYVKSRLPEPYRDARDKYRPIIRRMLKDNQNKPDEEKLQPKVIGTQLFVNGKLYRDPVYPPTKEQMLKLTDVERKQFADISIATSEELIVNEAKFRGFAPSVNSARDIDLAYMATKDEYKEYDHVMVAFNYFKDGQPITSSCNDGEIVGGLKVASVIYQERLKNVAIFVARKYGGVPLGQSKFRPILKCAQEAVEVWKEH